MTEFSFKHDLKYVQWGRTAWVGFLRSFFAGIIWAIFMMMQGEAFAQSVQMLLFPLIYYVFLLPFGMVCGLLSSWGVPFVGLVTILFSVMIVIGDPFVFILSKINERIVPVENFGFLNFRLIIFVLDEEKRQATVR